ncbi:D-alanyl-D-alanine carboxypeptidase [Chryseobacterium sp. T16E-39]|uniref:serine hydrolase domain-containing protein n=1 Tax=Chryseobacterium sp. T16E-39 TaxID=2015076 RepID=UPI000B5B263F|nr:serine hydrolase domain-containing protein [Chryseobacterium sp. T16E-39]ASK30199.1 D-alanyl-D-alanine carboxypeptidase [Chryseobacterium sp. T16E-39]
MFKKIFFCVSIGAFNFGFGQNIDREKLDNYFKTLDKEHKVMGSFAIADHGKVIYSNAIGFSDVESKRKADFNTVYRIGSITKTFTAVLIMKAVEEKKVTLDTNLSQFFPQIKNAEKIKIEYLLNHRSGIHNFTDDDLYATYYQQAVSEEKLIDIIQKAGSDFEPGTKFSYSNSNYSLLGIILEKVYKKRYAQIIEGYIAKPLQLKYTKVGGKIDPSKNEANSYTYENGNYIKSPETDMSVPIGAGNLVSTPSELVIFMNGLTSGKLISKESLEKMRTFKDHYGFGLGEVPFMGKMGFGHNGGIDRFSSILYYFPDGEKTFAMISNQSNFDNNNISITALSAAYGKDFEIPNLAVITLSESELQQFTGTYATTKMPMKIDVFVKDKVLMAQATGQGAFPLEATSKTSFKFDTAGIVINFNPAKKELVLSQGGNTILFTKE